ncbi:hypothetical protein MNB_SV-6-1741 [hydrothermal vent metagenome]|uniref:DUF1656 domain-containing protein n=1 Tax=hydrothermal vent metagenome TaxID=652676 RepID=A0A1W1BY98_9ZZZZ
MSNSYPHELSIGDLYFSPILPVLFFAFISTTITVFILNKLKLSHFFYAPPYLFLAIMTLYIVLIDRYLIKF